MLWIPLLISIAFFVLDCFFPQCTDLKIWGTIFTVIAIFALAGIILIRWLEQKTVGFIDGVKSKIPAFMLEKLKNFENLKVSLLTRMVKERLSSSFLMINDIFLKQIRRLNYQLLYTDEKLAFRRVTSTIYELTEKQYVGGESDEKNPEKKYKKIEDPGDRIYASAKIATEMGTTLWFSPVDREVHRLKNLVCCGQFTACYNLLKYCHEIKDAIESTRSTVKPEVDKEILAAMIKVFQYDWKRFIKNPYWLHEELNSNESNEN